MKRLLMLITSIIAIVSMTVVAGAAGISADEKKVLDLLRNPVVLGNGQKVSIPEAYVNQAENYLLNYDMTADESTQVTAKINEGIKLVKDNQADIKVTNNTIDLNQMPASFKTDLLKVGQEAASVTGCTLTYDGTNVTITKKAADGTNQVLFSNNPIIKNTGSAAPVNYAFVLIATFAGLTGAAFIYAKKNRLFN